MADTTLQRIRLIDSHHQEVDSCRPKLHSARRTILLVGYFLSASLGTRGVGEDLAIQLGNSGWEVMVTSHKTTRLTRLVDMIGTVVKQRHKYHIAQVNVYSGWAFFWAEVICQLLRFIRKPFVLSLHGGDLPNYAARWPRRVTYLLRVADVVTTPSAYLQEQLRPYRSDLIILPNGLDLSKYQFRLRNRAKPEIIWLRTYHSVYNPSLAILVASILVEDFPDLHLTMVGADKRDGSFQRARQLASDLKLEKQITFGGSVPKTDVSYWMNKGDIFLNTSDVDNAPVSVLEAMACGLCVVSTAVGGIVHLLDHGHDSLLVPPNDPMAMSSAVLRVLKTPSLSATLSANARHKAEKFDWSLVGVKWEVLLSACAKLK